MLSPALRKTLLVVAVLFALAAPASQALFDWGLSQEEFAEDGNETLRAAGYAFSIWGLIYAGLAGHAAFSLFAKARQEPLMRALSPAIIAIFGCGAWIVASAMDWKWASVAIIVVSAASAWRALDQAKDARASLVERLFNSWPVALLGGWLLTAAALNILTVATGAGLIGSAAATPAALTGIVAVAALAILVMLRGVTAVYGVPVVWGLFAIFIAEQPSQPVSAYAAGAAAAVGATVAGVMAVLRMR